MMMILNPPPPAAAAAGSSSSSSCCCVISAGIINKKKKRSLLHPICLPYLKLGSHRRGPSSSSSSSSSSSIFLTSSSSSSSLRFGNGNTFSSWSYWNRPLSLLSSELVRATAEIAGDGGKSDNDINFDSKPTNTTGGVLYLGALFGLWYLFNIYFSIYNKQVLNVYPFPLTISAFHFAIGTLFILVMWTTNLSKIPNISSSQLMAIVPLAIVHTMGNLFTNMSLGKVAVSFTHTIKAMEPFFTVVLSALFMGEVPTIWVLSSLVPIVGGVALASLTEASFNWAGLWSAMASNLTYQSRNVLSKKIMADKEESLDNITLFSIITIMSFFLSVPVALFVEGVNFTPSYIQSAGLSVREIYTRSILAGLCFHVYQQVAYMILARVSPVSHSIGNCVKRVVIIVSSVLFFRTPVSPINSLGTGVALAGVFLYSRVKNIKAKAS